MPEVNSLPFIHDDMKESYQLAVHHEEASYFNYFTWTKTLVVSEYQRRENKSWAQNLDNEFLLQELKPTEIKWTHSKWRHVHQHISLKNELMHISIVLVKKKNKQMHTLIWG